MDQFWKTATYVLLIFAFVAALANAAGFASGAGTLFGGLSGLGKTIIGTGR